MGLSATRAVKKSDPSPAPIGQKNINLNRKPNDTGLIGDLPPVGFWDPAGFAEKATPEELSRYSTRILSGLHLLSESFLFSRRFDSCRLNQDPAKMERPWKLASTLPPTPRNFSIIN